MGLEEQVQPADAPPGKGALYKRQEAITPSSVSSPRVETEDVAELARALCGVTLDRKSGQDSIFISHTTLLITSVVSNNSRTP